VGPTSVGGPPVRVVVTGIGVVSGPAFGVDAFWAALLDPTPRATHRIAKGFRPRDWLDRRSAQRTARFAQLAVAAGRLAHDDAGAPELDADRTAVILGAGTGGLETILAAERELDAHGATAVPHLLPVQSMSNAGSANVAFQLGARGAVYSVSAGCASGTQAIGDGLRAIRSGQASVVYAGASDSSISHDDPERDVIVAGLVNLRVHTTERTARPFDRQRDGFVFAEGAAVLRLESADAARARGARAYAEVLGAASTADAYDLIAPEPTGEGLRRAMTLALAEGGATAADVRHVNTHGTATQSNDSAELAALRLLFGRPGPAVNSVKGVTGHAGAASGAIEAAAVALAIERRVLPPTGGLIDPDPKLLEGIDILTEARPWEPGVSLSNSLSLGGLNSSVAVGPPPD